MPGLKIIVADVDYVIHFTHTIYDHPGTHNLPSGKPVPVAGRTRCSLLRDWRKIRGSGWAEAWAYCSITDKFNTGTGRRLAFGRAALKMWPDKTDRTEAWAEFFRLFPWSKPGQVMVDSNYRKPVQMETLQYVLRELVKAKIITDHIRLLPVKWAMEDHFNAGTH